MTITEDDIQIISSHDWGRGLFIPSVIGESHTKKQEIMQALEIKKRLEEKMQYVDGMFGKWGMDKESHDDDWYKMLKYIKDGDKK
jgi:hypothetical protein